MPQSQNIKLPSAKIRVKGQMVLPIEVRQDLDVDKDDFVVFERIRKGEWRIKGVNVNKVMEA